MRVSAAILVLLAATAFRPAAAQWRIGLELAATHYGGSARDTAATDSGPPSFRPGDATTIALRLERTIGRFSIALRTAYGKPGLAFAGEGLTVTIKTVGELLEAASLVSIRVGGIGPVLTPSGDLAADMENIRAFYAGIAGKFPALTTPVRLLEEDQPAVA